MTVRLPMQLSVGDTIRLQLDPDAEEPTLKISQDGRETSILNRLLIQALPRQGQTSPDLGQSLHRLAGLARELSPETLTGIRALLALLPRAASLGRGETLAQWLTGGGLQLERRLAESLAAETRPRTPANDFKAALLRLGQALEQAGQPRQATAPRNAAAVASPGQTPAVPLAGGQSSAATPIPGATAARAPTSTILPPTGAGAVQGTSTSGTDAPSRQTPQTEMSVRPAAPSGTARPEVAAAGMEAGDAEPLAELLVKLRSQVESSLAGVQLNQARLLQTQADGNPNWVLDIPLADRDLGDQVRLSMHRQARQSGEDRGWSAELVLQPPALGTLTVRLHLSGKRLRAVFWAEDPRTARQLTDALPLLDAALSAVGLDVTASHCYPGRAPGVEAGFESGILDLRA